MTWAKGIKDAISVTDELILEYKDLHLNQTALITEGRGSIKLAVDYSLVLSALKRVIDCLEDLQEPEVSA